MRRVLAGGETAMTTYALRLTSRYDGMVVGTFPDVPEAIGYGRDDEEAREEAVRALERVLEAARLSGEALPVPRATGSQWVTAAEPQPEIIAAAIS
jgi:predicted RNase H-like HicB family nuclease